MARNRSRSRRASRTRTKPGLADLYLGWHDRPTRKHDLRDISSRYRSTSRRD